MPVDFSNAWKTGIKIINESISLLPNIILGILIFVVFLVAASAAKSLTRRLVLRRRTHQGMGLLLGRLVDGLKGLLELSKAFGDVLSYLRLFALGLAAVKLAEVFNHLAATSFEAKGVGVLLGVGTAQCSEPGLEPARRLQPGAAHPDADLLVTGG